MAERDNRRSARRRGGRLVAIAAALGVASCGTASEYGGYGLVTQDRYDYMSCEDLRNNRVALTGREKELAGLIDKANTGGIAGVIVGATTYRSELEYTRASLRFLAKSEREKRCPPPKI
jgi:hypothetical protein